MGYNLLFLQFLAVESEPSWFVLLEKEAYFQVLILSALTVRYLVFDRTFKNFVLITENKRRESVQETIEIRAPMLENETVQSNDTMRQATISQPSAEGSALESLQQL